MSTKIKLFECYADWKCRLQCEHYEIYLQNLIMLLIRSYIKQLQTPRCSHESYLQMAYTMYS